MATGKEIIDRLVGSVQLAEQEHQHFHTNARGLKNKFKISWKEAKTIVRSCPACSALNIPHEPPGVNPRGTHSNDLWQMDVTQYSAFRKLKYLHHSLIPILISPGPLH